MSNVGGKWTFPGYRIKGSFVAHTDRFRDQVSFTVEIKHSYESGVSTDLLRTIHVMFSACERGLSWRCTYHERSNVSGFKLMISVMSQIICNEQKDFVFPCQNRSAFQCLTIIFIFQNHKTTKGSFVCGHDDF